jgi:hypothetical protein
MEEHMRPPARHTVDGVHKRTGMIVTVKLGFASHRDAHNYITKHLTELHVRGIDPVHVGTDRTGA